MKSNNNNNNDDDDDDDNNNNTAMGSVHARGNTFLTFGLKALTETNTSRLATAINPQCVTTQKASTLCVSDTLVCSLTASTHGFTTQESNVSKKTVPIFSPEDGKIKCLRNDGICLEVHEALQLRRP
jgi:hypothetical protein